MKSNRRSTHPAPESGIARLVAVSNRLPIALRKVGGKWQIQPGGGGLVTAISPVLRHRGGLWIGWSGTTEEVNWETELDGASLSAGYTLVPVTLTHDEAENFYLGFANQIIWPLFHDLQTRCNFEPIFWRYYLQVNNKYASVIASHSQPSDFIWVHDYHLMTIAQSLRALGIERKTGFFLHIPFPPVDIFFRLPWRAQILQALLEFDILGFQTLRDRRNFIQCLQYLSPSLKTSGHGAVLTVNIAGRSVRIGSFPISIDFDEFAVHSASREVESRVRWLKESMLGSQIVLGVDRLDYTKGLPERLNAFRLALQNHPDIRRRLTFVQVVVPSRTDVLEYQALKAEVEQLVGEINGEFTTAGWVPIHYIFRNLQRDELLAYYRTAQVALVTPVKDGMNLVAKEYCACHLDDDGVLILSEFAGAAAELQRGALLVNPYDVEGVAQAIYKAFSLSADEKRARMRRLRDSIKKRDIYYWVDSYLKAALSKKLHDFPMVEDYVPPILLRTEI
ncbi:MAG: trehalose-6-phosphate synthase [Calditrichaeota bacterium]|nr:trehalose-6-phosphate synthase [Calditrichota bacterium]